MAKRMVRSGRKTDYLWANMADSNPAVDLAEGAVGVGNTGLLSLSAFTIYRVRGTIGVQLDTSAVDERAVIQFGMALVSSAAFAAGGASIPSPVTEASYPWLWRGEVFISSLAEAAVVNDFLSQTIKVDSKAMRKSKPDEALVLVAEVAASVDQGGSFDFVFSINSLSGS